MHLTLHVPVNTSYNAKFPIFTADSYKNEYVRVAYESVLILSLMRQEGRLYEQFKSEVQIRALRDYGYNLDQSEAVCHVVVNKVTGYSLSFFYRIR